MTQLFQNNSKNTTMPTPQTVEQLNNQVDQDITSKTTRKSITPLILGSLLKTIIAFLVNLINTATIGSGGSQVTRRYKNDTATPLTTATNGRILSFKPNTKDIVKLPQTSRADAEQAKFLIPITDFPKLNNVLSNFTVNMNGADLGTNINFDIIDAFTNNLIKEQRVTCDSKFRNAIVRIDFPSSAPIEPPTQIIQIGVNNSTPNPTDGDTIVFLSGDESFDKTYTFRDTPTLADEIQIGVSIGSTIYNVNEFLLATGYFVTSGIVDPTHEMNYAYKFLHTTEDKRYIDAVAVTFPTVDWGFKENVSLNVTLGNAALAIKAKIDNAENILMLQSWQDVTPHPVISWYDLFHRTYNAFTPFGQIFNSSRPEAGAFGYYWFNNGNAALYDVIVNTANGGYSFTTENGFIWETANPPVDESESTFNVTLDYFAATYEILQTTIATNTDTWLKGDDNAETLNNLKTFLDALTPVYFTTTIDTGNNTVTITVDDYGRNFNNISNDLQVLETVNYDTSQLLNYLNNYNSIYMTGLGVGNFQLQHPYFACTIDSNRTKGTEVTINSQTYKLCDNIDDYIDNVMECYVLQNSILTSQPDQPAKYTLTKIAANEDEITTGIEVNSVGATDGYVSWQFGSQYDAYFGQILYLTQFVAELKQMVRETTIGVQVGIDDATGEVIVSPLTNINEVEIHPDAIAFLEDNNIPYEGINAPSYGNGNPNNIIDSLWIVWNDGYVMPLSFVTGVLYNGEIENFFTLFSNGAFTPIKGTTNATTKFEVQLFQHFSALMAVSH